LSIQAGNALSHVTGSVLTARRIADAITLGEPRIVTETGSPAKDQPRAS
jgi:hypothetical protein